jgi:hypothetical protein
MKHLLKSLLLGLGIELILFAVSEGLIAVGGWGPCGPAGYASLIGVWLQYPGFFLLAEYSPRYMGLFLDLAVIFLIQVLFWTLICWAFLTYKSFAKRRRAASVPTQD